MINAQTDQVSECSVTWGLHDNYYQYEMLTSSFYCVFSTL